MAKPAAGKFLINGSTVHPLEINGKVTSNGKTGNHKQDNISLSSVSSVSSNVHSTRTEKPVRRAEFHIASNQPTTTPVVVITELSEDESELEFKNEESEPPKLPPTNKILNGLKTGNSAAAKWARAGRQVRRAVAVRQALQRPETREAKVRKQLYGSKAALPVLPVPIAITLLVFNILIPGLGTVIAGFTFCCCATTYDKPDRKGIWEKISGLIYTNLMVGFAQLFTVCFVLVGWFWSIAWGVIIVQLALEREKEKREGSDWFPDAIP